MAIENVKMRKIARELQEWVYLGIQDGMVQSARDYKSLIAAGRTAEAEAQIKRAADMPFRAIARIEAYEAQYTAAYLDKCLALYGDCTLTELKTAIKAMQPYALERVKEIIDQKIDSMVAADAITADVKPNAADWVFVIPATYKDVCTVEAEKTAEVIKA